MKKKEILKFFVIILIFIIFNISLMLVKGKILDIDSLQGWGNDALKNGSSSPYIKYRANYPPIAMHILKFNAWLNLKLFGNNEIASRQYLFISKIIPVLCNLIIGVGIFWFLNKKNYRNALLGMCLYLFNPAIIHQAAYWGQIDSITALFMFFSIIFLIFKKYSFSLASLIMGIFVKINAFILLPIIGIIILTRVSIKKVIKIVVVNLSLFIFILLPYILGGSLPYVIFSVLRSIDNFPHVSINAYNFWFLISPHTTDWFNSLKDSYLVFGISLKTIGLILSSIFIVIVLYQILRNKDNVILASASTAFAFFMLPTQVHERYIFPFFALFSLILFENRKYLYIFIILSLTNLINLMIILPFEGGGNIFFTPFQYLLNFLITKFSLVGLAIIIALINTAVFIYFIKIGIFNNLLNNLKGDLLRFKIYIKNIVH